MLRFDLAEVIRTPGMRQTLEINEPPFEDEDVEYVSPLRGRVVVTNTGTLLLVRGPIDTVIAEHCSRCLTDVRVPIHADLEEDFDLKVVDDPAHHGRPDPAVQVVEDDEIGRVFEGKVLMLDVLIRQAALLAAPLQPLCRDACPGIAVASGPETTVEPEFQNSPFRDLSRLLDQEDTKD